MANLAAANPGVVFLLVNAEANKPTNDCLSFAKKNSADKAALHHCKLADGASPIYKGYYPYHCVFKDGKCVMSGGYDMSTNAWKAWEKIAGLTGK